MTAPIDKLEPVVSEASLLTLVMVEQTIIQGEISSYKTFDGTKSKFESWIVSVVNTAQISGHEILCSFLQDDRITTYFSP